MTAAKEARGLHAKLAEVMAEAERIPKNGKAAPQMGGYAFVQVGDAADAIRKALGERGVSMLPTTVEVIGEAEHATKSGGTMTTQTVRTTWTLTDGETGQTAAIQSLGTGADSGDKFSPKAQTNAMKYALLMGFLLSTGDDPEGEREPEDRQPSESRVEGGERVDLIGIDTLSGKVAKGGADRYQAEWRETPSGWVIGFAVKGSDKSYPQVGIMGDIAAALYLAGGELIGQHIRARGRFYRVSAPGRTAYTRVIVGQGPDDFIETDEWRIPPADEPAEPVEAPSIPMLLTDDEKAAIAGGLT